MKKVAIALIALLPLASFAQPNNRTSAIMILGDAQKAQAGGDDAKAISEYKKAAGYIDKAAVHEKTKNDPKTLFNMGEIYFGLVGMEGKAGNLASAADFGGKAVEGYSRCIAAKGGKGYDDFAPKSYQRAQFLNNLLLNQGVQSFNEKKYDDAIKSFKVAIDAAAINDMPDSLALYNTGLAYERMEDYTNAVNYYQKCAEIGYRGAQMHLFIIYAMKRSEAATEDIVAAIKKGRTAYPNDKDLIIEELNIYLRDGDFAKAESNLQLAIDKDPKNEILHFSMGSVYDNLRGNEEDVEKKDIYFQKAEKAYLNALELKPDYFDANYNLGALYFNQGVEANNALDIEMSPSEYKKAKAAIDVIFEKSIPYLEKARKLKPEDQNTLASLQQVYARTNQTEKYTEVKKALEALRN